MVGFTVSPFTSVTTNATVNVREPRINQGVSEENALPFYDDGTLYHNGVTWDTCTLRSWLNGYDGISDGLRNVNSINYSAANANFMDIAFTEEKQAEIRNSTVE